MPNWVYNNITIVNADPDELSKFIDHINTKPAFLDDEEWTDQREFSFHSFVTLDRKYREEYKTTHGSGPEGPTGDTEHNWYNWNNANWFTKWDASGVDINYDGNSVNLYFETAWSPPIPVFQAIAQQFPNLVIDFRWEEEQGYGGEFQSVDGALTQTKSWDIPSSHQEYEELDRECICGYYDDPSDWFEDCPRTVFSIYEVDVITKYRVKTFSEDLAIRAAKAEEGGHDLPANVEVVEVLYADDYKLSKILSEGEATEVV